MTSHSISSCIHTSRIFKSRQRVALSHHTRPQASYTTRVKRLETGSRTVYRVSRTALQRMLTDRPVHFDAATPLGRDSSLFSRRYIAAVSVQLPITLSHRLSLQSSFFGAGPCRAEKHGRYMHMKNELDSECGESREHGYSA